ncbi:xylulose kinase [Enemella evansiae]|uniref:Xylulose kinase n=2 Tax=Enemella evansiae TaxID=2016499 RepID=A0A255G3S9_9ACTN|nr:xylulose kinase [Enemella evansiae]
MQVVKITITCGGRMTARFYVGVDVGTTGTKAVVFDEELRIAAMRRVATPWRTVATGAETDPLDLLEAAKVAIHGAIDAAPAGEVAALGVAGLAESGVLLDRAGRPVAPVIAWHDRRDDAQLADLGRCVGESRFAAMTGLPLRQQWSLTKHRWLLDNQPSARTAVRRLNVPEWIVRGLGGDEVSEYSLASRTGWLSLQDRDWWTDGLEWSGADTSLLPELVPSGTPAGVASDVLPAAGGAVLTVAGHDHQVAAIGADAVGVGDELDSCGTAEALVRSTAPGLPTPEVLSLTARGITVGWHAAPDRWCLLGATQGGLVLQRILGMLGISEDQRPALERRSAELGHPRVRVIAPPFGDLDIVGVDDDCEPAEVWWAAVSTVTDQIGMIHDAMNSAAGHHSRIVVTGGWANSHSFLEAKVRRLGPVIRTEVDEAGARGAATAAMMAWRTHRGTGA